VRNERFHLVNNQELYDLDADPLENENVAGVHPDVIANMRRAYGAWWGEARLGMVNELAEGPAVNPFKQLYWLQMPY